ncbi:MAG: PAS domain S-box protein, partial [Gammaproteobacteria bacterium]|nr:PAS domain S-box protein [Gammaproteobacteria bacterium]
MTSNNLLEIKEKQSAPPRQDTGFRKFYDETPAILQVTDADGRLIHVSRFWLDTLGYEADFVLGRKWFDFLAPESRKRYAKYIAPGMKRSGRCENERCKFLRKDGGVENLSLTARTLSPDD